MATKFVSLFLLVTLVSMTNGRSVKLSLRQLLPFLQGNNNNNEQSSTGSDSNPIASAIGGAFQNGIGMFQNGIDSARNASQQAVAGGLGQAHTGVDMMGAAVNAGISAAFAVVSTFANVFLNLMEQGGRVGAGFVPPNGGLPLPIIG